MFLYNQVGHVYRIIFLTVLVVGCLTHWHWKASLISLLSVVLPFSPFSSLEELLHSPYDVTCLGNSAPQIDFEEAKSGIFRELWLNKFSDKNKSLAKSTKESSQLALSSQYSQYLDFNTARSLDEYKDCKLKIMKFQGRKIQIAYAFPRKSPYLEIFNRKLQQMDESGELMKITDKYLEATPECNKSKGKPLGFENIVIIFLIISTGILASLILFVLEKVFGRKIRTIMIP